MLLLLLKRGGKIILGFRRRLRELCRARDVGGTLLIQLLLCIWDAFGLNSIARHTPDHRLPLPLLH